MTRSRLAALRKQVSQLVQAAPKPGQGAGWLAIWRLDDLVREVASLVPREITHTHQRSVALAFIALKEAERLGFSGDPAYTTAQAELSNAIEMAKHPPAGVSWQDRQDLDAVVISADAKLAAVILKAWGVPDGPLGPSPPGGRPRRDLVEFPKEWFTESESTGILNT